jgi:pimeloyl-ACP methyl ester carboxylesterase
LGRDWDLVANRLEDHRVLIVDRPGYGASGSDALDIAASAELFGRLLVERGAAPATVVGHSYGGGIAIMLAARHPELVSGVVLAASIGRTDNVTVVDHVLAGPVVGALSSAVGLFTLGHVLPHVRRLAGSGEHRVTEWLRATLPDSGHDTVSLHPGRRVWRTFVAEQRTLMREIADVEAALGSVRAPTAVLSGDWDIVVPPRVCEAVAAAVVDGELVRLARTGHFIPRDAPDAVAAAVRAVERRVRAAGRPVRVAEGPVHDDSAGEATAEHVAPAARSEECTT